MTRTLHRLPAPLVLLAGLILAALAALALAALVGAPGEVVLLPALGAVSLVEAAKLSENDLQRGVVETFIIESAILDRAPTKEIDGNAYAYNEEATLPGVEFRAVNAAYSESTGTVNQRTEGLVILGGDADVDNFIVKTRSTINDQKGTQTALKVKAAAFKLQDTLINGDVAVDANSFDGLKKRLTGAQVIAAATNGLPIIGADTNARHTFLDFLDLLIAAVPGLNGDNGALYMNDLVKAKIMGSARREHIATTTVDDFGKTTDRYRGIALVDVGSKADGTRIIPQTETQGTATDASSIYAVKFGLDEADRAVTILYNGPDTIFDVRDLGELQAKPSERVRIEGFVGMAVFGGKAAARGTGVRAA
jgi:hypothetical protein